MAKKNVSKSGMLSTNATVAENRRAKFDYELEDKFEAGIELTGTEVKSLRLGQASINEAYVGPKGNEIYIFNANIPEYQQAGPKMQHQPSRARKLLLHRREINKLLGAVTKDGYSIIPTRLYFNRRGMAKIEVALGKGKKTQDKRENIKKRDWGREKQRILKNKN